MSGARATFTAAAAHDRASGLGLPLGGLSYFDRRLVDPRFERDRLDFFAGTFPPARRASDSPIAIACFRLLTLLPERPDLSVPLFRSCIAFSTFEEAFLPYFRAMLES
jgi:hypothetical protein